MTRAPSRAPIGYSLLVLSICACGSERMPHAVGGGAESGREAMGGSSAGSDVVPSSGGAAASPGGGGSGGESSPSGMAGSGGGGKGGALDGGAPGGGQGSGAAGAAGELGATGGASAAGNGGGNVGGTGGSLATFTCPSAPFVANPVASGAAAERIAGVPPDDGFITSTSDVDIIEGPVWLDGVLYLSEIENGSAIGGPGGGGRGGATGSGGGGARSDAPPARILKVTEAGEVSVAIPDAGTNGLGLDGGGNLVGCSHKTGSVARLSLSGGAPVDLVSTYQGVRFNSPNDLTFGADGTLYFTDPDHQSPVPAPQAARLAYRVAPGTTTAIPLADGLEQPNGITLSPDRLTLYVSTPNGVFSHPVLGDGSVGGGTRFAEDAVRSSDGMAVDCAGNLYTTSGANVIVVNPLGTEIGRVSVSGVQQVTNVAFGGTERKTLYVTALGSNGRSGLFRVASEIPGMPY
jgi:gluconolactonase